MPSEEFKALAAEVEKLRSIPAGPRRGAACAQPRRRIWDLLAVLQDHLAAGGEDVKTRAEEVLDRCRRLQELLSSLRAMDISSRESHWVLTDYAALAAELAEQCEMASKCLLVDDTDLLELALATETSAPEIELTPGSNTMRIKEVNDLQLDYPCGWSPEDGVCDRGCMVGGCPLHVHAGVEAW
mmetsp:Transcript_172519/g.419656  ORF Transcript_172519/g.419656 Transcript_172519/m.419656 type:complete len:184 (+) Transcript_172519:83-634(+)